MTQRVKCSSSNGHQGCGKSWNLYDPFILAQLPKELAAEFPGVIWLHLSLSRENYMANQFYPAFLTHRSGIDKDLMTLICSGMANGLCANSWAKIL